jgi:hypothetical protein
MSKSFSPRFLPRVQREKNRRRELRTDNDGPERAGGKSAESTSLSELGLRGSEDDFKPFSMQAVGLHRAGSSHLLWEDSGTILGNPRNDEGPLRGLVRAVGSSGYRAATLAALILSRSSEPRRARSYSWA